MLKSLTNSPLVQTLIGRLVGGYMLAAGWTARWTFVNRGPAEAVWASGGPAIACFWHGRIILSHRGWAKDTKLPVKVLISNSRDGGIVASATRTVGRDVIRGSSPKGNKRKGAVEAMRQMIRHMQDGGVVGIAPDGPRGPRMQAQIGPVLLAKRMNAPIVCYAWSTRGRKVFKSWDRFVLPFWFSRAVMVWGDPIRVAPDADDAEIERARADLERELNRVTAEADRLAGVAQIEPAPRTQSELEPAVS